MLGSMLRKVLVIFNAFYEKNYSQLETLNNNEKRSPFSRRRMG